MKMHDWNKEKAKTVLLIHPMLASANSMKSLLVNHWGGECRCLVPDLSGHGEAVGQTYQSAKDEARAIHDYLKENDALDIKLGFGASLGGVVLLELLKYEDIHFEHVFFEGTSFYEHAALLNFALAKVFIKKHRKAARMPELAVEEKMATLYGKETGSEMAKGFIRIGEESIKNIVHDCAYVELPALSEALQARCTFAYGEKDFDLKPAKKLLPVKYPKAELRVWPGCAHCEKMTAAPSEYAGMLQKYLD